MTDNEIIKALECFALDKDFDDSQCIGCAFEHQFCTANMSVDIAKPALSIINRQKAEIERLKAESAMADGYADALEERAKAEAIREFAERLKDKMFCEDFLLCEPCDMAEIIDSLVKEMVGDE